MRQLRNCEAMKSENENDEEEEKFKSLRMWTGRSQKI